MGMCWLEKRDFVRISTLCQIRLTFVMCVSKGTCNTRYVTKLGQVMEFSLAVGLKFI